jgi:manganese transport protein
MTQTQLRPDAPGARPSASHEGGETFDPYALTPEAIEEPPRSIGRTLLQIGPGLILAGSIVGTGELIATTNLGATVGFMFLWLVIASCFVKVFVQAELGRYAISSGDGTLQAFRRVPVAGGVFGWWWLVMMLLTQFQLGAMVGGVGQAAHMALPSLSPALARAAGAVHSGLGGYLSARPDVAWAVVTAVVTSALLALGSYGVVEKLTTIMVVLFTLMTVLCVVLLPAAGHSIDWGAVGAGLTFRLPRTDVETAAALTMFGITGVGAAELIAYPYWCIEKGYARKTGPRNPHAPATGRVLSYETSDNIEAGDAWAARAKGWLRVMRVDVWFSFAIYTLATLAFYALGAAVLFRRGGKGLPGDIGLLLNELSHMYVPVMGARGAKWFIVIGCFAVLYSTLYSATAANSRALADFVRVNHLGAVRSPQDRLWWVRLFCVLFPLVDLALYLAFGNAVKMVMYGGIAQAATLPMIGAAALWLRYRRTDRRLAPGLAWDVFLWLSVLAFCAVAGYGVRKLF